MVKELKLLSFSLKQLSERIRSGGKKLNKVRSRALEDIKQFWAQQAKRNLIWSKEWNRVLDWNYDSFSKWFGIVLFSLVRNNQDKTLGALAELPDLNVSRAKKKLIIIGSFDMMAIEEELKLITLTI